MFIIQQLNSNIECEERKWNCILADVEKTKDELSSVENVFSDQQLIKDLQVKIEKRREKHHWWRRRQHRRYLQRLEDEEKTCKLHEKIDAWQKDLKQKDISARKAASLKHEAGGVLDEVRRKLQDCRKLEDLIQALVKLRQLRKDEGEKKGVYPKTTSVDDECLKSKCERISLMLKERKESYEEEEKTLQVMIAEEKDEQEEKDKLERLQQKALLNLAEENDHMAEFSRYYEQADISLQHLLQIRQGWDIYITQDTSLGSRIPNCDISPVSPTSSQWEACLDTNHVKVHAV